jgi:hypothetical protein
MNSQRRTGAPRWVALVIIVAGPLAALVLYSGGLQWEDSLGFLAPVLGFSIPCLPLLGCVLLIIVGPGRAVRWLAAAPFLMVGAALGVAACLESQPHESSEWGFALIVPFLFLGGFSWLAAFAAALLAVHRSS